MPTVPCARLGPPRADADARAAPRADIIPLSALIFSSTFSASAISLTRDLDEAASFDWNCSDSVSEFFSRNPAHE